MPEKSTQQPGMDGYHVQELEEQGLGYSPVVQPFRSRGKPRENTEFSK